MKKLFHSSIISLLNIFFDYEEEKIAKIVEKTYPQRESSNSPGAI